MVWIRVDGNGEIGIGHVMRCVSIAEELQSLGEDVYFILADESVLGILHEKKMQYLILYTEYNNMEKELIKLEELLCENKPDILLIDSYSVTNFYLKRLRRLVKTVYIDDLAMYPYPVNMLINYNIYAAREMYEPNTEHIQRFLLGSKFAPLRNEFRVEQCGVSKEVKDIFISTGGSDKYNITGKLLDCALRDEYLQRLNYHVICGKFNIHIHALEKKEEQNANIHIYRNVTNMAEIMTQCDLAISAAGFTLYELASLNIPMISFSFANNQKQALKTFEERNAVVSIGHYEMESEKEYMEHFLCVLQEMCHDYNKRVEITENAHDLVDGMGAKRIASELLDYIREQ